MCLPYLKFSDPLPETESDLFFLFDSIVVVDIVRINTTEHNIACKAVKILHQIQWQVTLICFTVSK